MEKTKSTYIIEMEKVFASGYYKALYEVFIGQWTKIDIKDALKDYYKSNPVKKPANWSD